MFDKKVKFTKVFTSPAYGNVYLDKEMVVSHKQAKALISAGLAVEVVAESLKEEKVNGVNFTKRSKKSPKGRSKRRG